MENRSELLDSDEYTEAISDGRKGFVKSAITLAIAMLLFGASLVMAAGVPKLARPDFYELLVSGVEVLKEIVPSENVYSIVGVLATVAIAQTVSVRSMPSEVRKLQLTSSSDRNELKNAVRLASRLHSTLMASTLFSLMGAALAALLTLVEMLKGDSAAATVTGLLAVFLFFELVRLQQATADIDLFKRTTSSKERAAYQRSFATAYGQNWRFVAWYTLYLLSFIAPAIVAAQDGFTPMAIKIAFVFIITSNFGISAAISYVRGTLGVSVSSRAAARLLSPFLFLAIWMMFVQVALEFMSDADVDSWPVVNIYLASFATTLLLCILRIWGESGWLFFRCFGAQHTSILRVAGPSNLDWLTWTNLPKGTAGRALLECLPLCLIPITSAFVATNGGSEWYPIVLIALSLTVAAAARWSSNIERITGTIVSILIVAATGRKGFEALSADDTLVSLALAGSCLLTTATLMTIVWDRQRKVAPLRHLLLILDLDFARRYRQDTAETGGSPQRVSLQSHENTRGHLLVRRNTA